MLPSLLHINTYLYARAVKQLGICMCACLCVCGLIMCSYQFSLQVEGRGKDFRTLHGKNINVYILLARLLRFPLLLTCVLF